MNRNAILVGAVLLVAIVGAWLLRYRYDFRDCQIKGLRSICVRVDRLTGKTAVVIDGEDVGEWMARRESEEATRRGPPPRPPGLLWTDTLAWFYDSAQKR